MKTTLMAAPCVLSVFFWFCGIIHGGQHAQDSTPKVGDPNLEAKALAEVKAIFNAVDKDAVIAIGRKWRFDTPRPLQKQIIKSFLRSKETAEAWRGRTWEGINEFIHMYGAIYGNMPTKDEEPSEQRTYRSVIMSLWLPPDPDITKLYPRERFALARAKDTPTHVLEELVNDPTASLSAKDNLAKRKQLPKRKTNPDLSVEGGRAQWALEQLVHCTLPLSGAMAEDDKKKHLVEVYEALIDAMDMPFDPDTSKLGFAERLKLAWSEKTPVHVYAELVKDPEIDVRLALIGNREVPFRILGKLNRTDKRIDTALQEIESISFERAEFAQWLEDGQGAKARKLAAKTQEEISLLMKARDQSNMLAVTRRWRFETTPDLRKSIFGELLYLLTSEKQLPKSKAKIDPKALDGTSAPEGAAKDEPPPIKDNPLRHDKRLYALVHVEPDNPSLQHIVERLREGTKLDITISPSLKNHKPKYGYVNPNPKGWMAYQLMGLTTRHLENGRWEKTENGYQLEGKSLLKDAAPPEDPAPESASPPPAQDAAAPSSASASTWTVGIIGAASGFAAGLGFAPLLRRRKVA